MSPIQQMLLGVGAVATKTYVDDIFSTFLHIGTGSAKTINNGIDLAGKGGLIWGKTRNYAYSHVLTDTVRGASKAVFAEANSAEHNYSLNNTITSFNSNGYSVGSDPSGSFNYFESGGNKLVSYCFRRASGFFDIVTYTGTGSSQQIAHSLGCVPGFIAVKRLNGVDNWACWHRSLSGSNFLQLDKDDGAEENSNRFGANPTMNSSVFTVDSDNCTNSNNQTYVAYLWAGGEDQTTATARSVDYDGSDDNTVWQGLSGSNADDLTFGTGDFTVEGWAKPDSIANYPAICDFRDQSAGSSTTDGFWLGLDGGILKMWSGGAYLQSTGIQLYAGQWFHFAVVKNSGTIKIFVNGIQSGADYTSSTNFNNSNNRKMRIGSGYTGADLWNGKISNFRVTKGQALYTTAFKPSTEPLTTTSQGATASNVKLLCCNNSSTTGSTVTPVTPANNGSPTASTDSPFDDPAGFVFGENEDQNVIECGSYIGNGSSTGPEINLGFEPSWILLKNAASSRDWKIVDAMRGIATGGDDASLRPNVANTEDDESVIDLTPTGFKITASNAHYNENGETIIYCALRRSDGYVGKPPELGTGVFNVAVGTSATSDPGFTSGFPVDFALMKQHGSNTFWAAQPRLMQQKFLRTNTNEAEADDPSGTLFDYNDGYYGSGQVSDFWAWMWKRHAGFDVVTYKGSPPVGTFAHSLNKVPEMIWVKNREKTENWAVYHKGLDGGTNPETHYLKLNTTDAEADGAIWNDTAPTSTHFTVGNWGETNMSDDNLIAMLFASVDKISKCGFYDGSSSAQTITTGFQPRFVIIKSATGSASWLVLDTTRGWGDNAQPYPNQTKDPYLYLDSNAAQGTNHDFGKPTSTGFELTATADGIGSKYNTSGQKFIYYAHA